MEHSKLALLADGTPIVMQLIGPEARDCIRDGFSSLSRSSNIHRFHTYKKRLSERELDYLVAVDHINHLAIGAADASLDGLRGVGIIRYVKTAQDPAVAEVALTVIDEYQHRGVGTLLYDALLIEAGRHGIKRLLNRVGQDNVAMMALLKRYGYRRLRIDDRSLVLMVDVPDAPLSRPLAGRLSSDDPHVREGLAEHR